jgi:tRNA threonylcarbamoyladenosine biosynthesis protein TsaE
MFVSYFEGDTQNFAKQIAPKVLESKIVTFTGNLGSGKTLICRELIRMFCQDQEIVVNSPTFNIVKTYKSPQFIIHHFDLYRLKSLVEIEEIGLVDIINRRRDLCLIEWPQIIQEILPIDAFNVSIDLFEGNKRIISY